MSWNTQYISGKPGFKEEVSESLADVDLPIMPGSTGNDQEVILFWIDDRLALRDLKKAIGGKIVFKYRLQFYSTLEEWHQAQDKNSSLTSREEAMIREMTDWQSTKKYRHSA